MNQMLKTLYREAELQRRFNRWGCLKEPSRVFWDILYSLSFAIMPRVNFEAGVRNK